MSEPVNDSKHTENQGRVFIQVVSFRSLGVVAGIAVLAAASCTRTPVAIKAPGAESRSLVDRVVVRKADHRLFLLHGDSIVRTYPVSLGQNPVGQKERSGDSRTPEGSYRLESRNAHSDYFLSIKISYPSQADLEQARAHHRDPGGQIMIHGLPNELKHDPHYYETHDWTDGCIAVSNADMAEIWRLTPDNVPIDIFP